MINASELRIGTWFLFNDHSGDPLQPYQIQGDDISRAAVNGVYHEPIPLTPEILEAAGFVRVDRFYEKDEIILLNVGNVYLYHYSNHSDKRTTLKYLHQLQNLYFALTGKELNVNLEKPDEWFERGNSIPID